MNFRLQCSNDEYSILGETYLFKIAQLRAMLNRAYTLKRSAPTAWMGTDGVRSVRGGPRSDVAAIHGSF
jgi:hypothetical protein